MPKLVLVAESGELLVTLRDMSLAHGPRWTFVLPIPPPQRSRRHEPRDPFAVRSFSITLRVSRVHGALEFSLGIVHDADMPEVITALGDPIPGETERVQALRLWLQNHRVDGWSRPIY